jgi:membrane protein DedA with SNARE-associated domain
MLQAILSFLLLYKYAALFAITFAASVALPLPSAASVMASAAFASQGYFSMPWVIIVASLGNILGDVFAYVVIRRYGKAALYKIGLRKVPDSLELKVIEDYVKRWPGLIIFFSRFEVWATLTVNIISGLGKIAAGVYLTYVVIGEATEVLMYSGIGYIFGNNWQTINTLLGKFFVVISLGIAVLIIISYKKFIRRLVAKKKASLAGH